MTQITLAHARIETEQPVSKWIAGVVEMTSGWAASLGVGERADPPLRGWRSCFLRTYGPTGDNEAGSYLTCLFTSFVISNMLTCDLPLNTAFRLASALIIRRFFLSCRPFLLM